MGQGTEGLIIGAGAGAIAELLKISTRTLHRWYVSGKFGKSMKRINRKFV